jgi:hypothetical protein
MRVNRRLRKSLIGVTGLAHYNDSPSPDASTHASSSKLASVSSLSTLAQRNVRITLCSLSTQTRFCYPLHHRTLIAQMVL